MNHPHVYRSPVSPLFAAILPSMIPLPVFSNLCPACNVRSIRRCGLCPSKPGKYGSNVGDNCPILHCDGRIVDFSVLSYRACTWEKPYRWGFLWLRRCRLTEPHVHVRCLLCSYRGTMQTAQSEP